MTLSVIEPRQLAAYGGDLSSLLVDWQAALALRVAAGELADNSAQAYRRGAAKFLTWCESAGVPGVDADILRAWKAAELASGKKPASINAWLAGVKALFTWAVESRRLPFNPAENVRGATRKGTSQKHARESLTDLEVKRVLALPDTTTATGKRDAAILAVMAYTGARSVELHRADLVDLRTENGRLVLYVTGKGHREADSVVVIANREAENTVYNWLAARGDKPGPLFTSCSDRSAGGRLTLRGLRGIVKSYYRLAGVRGNKTTHSLRHTAISKAILNGAPIQKVQSMARHKSVDTTMIYYHEIDRLTNPAEEFISYD